MSANKESLPILKSKPETVLEHMMSDIVQFTEKKIVECLSDESSGLIKISPRVVIRMLMTNLMINLMFHAIDFNYSTLDLRLKDVSEMMDELKMDAIRTWQCVETLKASEEITN